MQFGQGLIRCHPYALAEINALTKNDTQTFDYVFWKHIGHLISNKVKMLTFAFTGGFLSIPSQFGGGLYKWERKLKQASVTFAYLSDLALVVYGGSLKRMEFLSGKFADILSQMYIAYCLMVKFKNDGKTNGELFNYSMNLCFSNMQNAFDDIYANLFGGGVVKVLGKVISFNKLSSRPTKKDIDAIAKKMQDIDFVKKQTPLVFTSKNEQDKLAGLEKCAVMYKQIEAVAKKHKLRSADEVLASVACSEDEKILAKTYLALLAEMVAVDHFELKTQFGS
jgi:acyl-CoA dehydrogenase